MKFENIEQDERQLLAVISRAFKKRNASASMERQRQVQLIRDAIFIVRKIRQLKRQV